MIKLKVIRDYPSLPLKQGSEVFALKSDNFASDAVFLTLIKGDIKSNRIARLLRNKTTAEQNMFNGDECYFFNPLASVIKVSSC